MKKTHSAFAVLLAIFSVFSNKISAQAKKERNLPGRISPQLEKLCVPKNLSELEKCYPAVVFDPSFDIKKMDWKINLTANIFENRSADFLASHKNGKKTAVFYWADGKMLPEEEIEHKENFWPIQYKYQNTLRDPKTYSDEEIERITQFGSNSSRRAQGGTPMFFFDFIYSAASQRTIEGHIISTTFLGKRTRIHERILPEIKKIEREIIKAAETDEETKIFVDELKSADAYYWRQIAGTSRKSFHSYGISIDVLPRHLRGKAIYWSWEKDRRGDKWMLTPLESRWTPGKKVIQIFEDNGFIWGGNWVIFDNMHFEYHPELTTFRRQKTSPYAEKKPEEQQETFLRRNYAQ